MEKNSKADRARQFMPFAALRGFEELIQKTQSEPCARHMLSEYEAEILSRKMARVERGTMLKVTHYVNGAYVTLEGMVSDIDFAMRLVRVVKTEISFDDIRDIEIVSENA